jgi:preprotein translocase subunit SecG
LAKQQQKMNIVIFKYTQIAISLLLIFFILIQSKSQGLSAGIGSAFSMYRSRRGVEKMVFILTIVFSILLVGNSLVILILSK